MKICIVTTMFPKYKGDYYGSFVFDEVKMLVEKGHEVHVVTQHNPGIPYNEIMDNIYVHRFHWLEPKKFKALVHFKGLKDNLRLVTYVISLFFSLMVIIRRYKIDVVHAHSTIPAGLLGVIVAKINGLKSIITAHGMDINNFSKESVYGTLISFSLNHCDSIITVSEDLAKNVEKFGINGHKIIVLRNTIDRNVFKPLKNEELRKNYWIDDSNILILFVGYLDTFKGIFELIDAFYELHKNRNLKLMMIGTGPQKDKLKNKIRKLKLENDVIFTGKISHNGIEKYYQMADIFVLPSYTEGLPVSLLEAMACGLPVVVSDVGGVSEVVKDNVNGFLIQPKNKDILVKKLSILTDDKELRDIFMNKSLETIVKGFDINKKVEKLIKLYKNLDH